MIALWLPCVPPTTTHQAKRIVRVRRFATLADKPELRAAKDMLDALLLPHQPAAPLVGPYRLTLRFVYPWRKGESKARRMAGSQPHTSRPDASNLAKTLEDRLVALRFIEDDNAAWQLLVIKEWGNEPGIRVLIHGGDDAA